MILTRQQWEDAWKPINDAMNKMPLMAFATFCDAHKAKLSEQYPGVEWDNGRYVVHLERAIRNGETVPPEILASVEPSPYHDTPLLAQAKITMEV